MSKDSHGGTETITSRKLDKKTTHALREKLHEKGFTVTVAFDTAIRLATAELVGRLEDGWKGKKAVSFPGVVS